MSKPWEQEWRVENDTYDTRPEVHGPNGLVATIHRRPFPREGGLEHHKEATARAKITSAAPDMARALLEVASEDGSLSVDGMPCWCTRQGRERMRDSGIIRHEGFCDRARAALRKAGVPL